jgi:DNA-binding CsgD family transcriptional regulator
MDPATPPALAVRAYLLAIDLDLPPPPGEGLLAAPYWSRRADDASRADPALRAVVIADCYSGRLFVDVAGIDALERELREAEPAARRAGAATAHRLLHGLAWTMAMRGESVDGLVAEAAVLGESELAIHHSVERVAAIQGLWRGQVDEARIELTRLLARCDERGEAEAYFVIRLQLCELELRAGQLDAASAWLEEWAEESDGPVAAPVALARCQAVLAATAGDPAGIAPLVGVAAEWAATGGDRWQLLDARRASGIGHLFTGDASRAAADLGAVWEHCRKEGITEPGVFPVAPDLVEALAATDDQALGREVVAELSHVAHSGTHPWAGATEIRCRALLRPGSAESPGALAEAANAYARLGLRFDRARCLLSLGRTLRAQRRDDEAITALESASAAFDELGCTGWAERARVEGDALGAARDGGRGGGGGRRRGTGRNGAGAAAGAVALTPAERRVAELVAGGHRNREVAAELFLNEKTVEAHLSRIYAKLGVRSRTELALRWRAGAGAGAGSGRR